MVNILLVFSLMFGRLPLADSIHKEYKATSFVFGLSKNKTVLQKYTGKIYNYFEISRLRRALHCVNPW